LKLILFKIAGAGDNLLLTFCQMIRLFCTRVKEANPPTEKLLPRVPETLQNYNSLTDLEFPFYKTF